MLNNSKIVVHYDEIALKGKNRRIFEEWLVKNIAGKARVGNFSCRVRIAWGRIFIDCDNSSINEFAKELKVFPGISNFGVAFSSKKDLPDLLKHAEEFAKEVDGKTFRVSAKRSDKSFAFNSQEIERAFADAMFDSNSNLKVSLKGFELEVQIEVLHKEILVYIKKKGVGGLPTGVSGKVVPLLSAGFDSPVASYLMQKRGAQIFPVHFHASEKTGEEPLQAVKELAKILAGFQGGLSLALIPVFEIQKYIAKNAPEKLRIVLIRRVFNRLAGRYAKEVGALALVTGESLGQVASQTLENMFATNDASTYPVLRPLVGSNKNEIIDVSRKIGTHDISARPCEDTCSLFLPKSPETKAKMEEVLQAEEELSLASLEDDAWENMEIIKIYE